MKRVLNQKLLTFNCYGDITLIFGGFLCDDARPMLRRCSFNHSRVPYKTLKQKRKAQRNCQLVEKENEPWSTNTGVFSVVDSLYQKKYLALLTKLQGLYKKSNYFSRTFQRPHSIFKDNLQGI